jgi:hypothetical protein
MTIPRLTRVPRVIRALLVLPLLVPLTQVAPADAKPGGSPADPARTATVMTRNLYLGSALDDILGALASGNLGAVVTAATQTWNTVQASDPAERMGVIADEIVRAKPLAVGLQEVSEWSTFAFNPQTQQVVGDPTVRYDFLDLLLDALAARGVSYREVPGATSTNFTSAPIPIVVDQPFPTQAVKLVDRDVILVRDGVKATNAHHGNFQTVLAPPLSPVRADRGWGSVDLRKAHAVFRFVNSHTEAFGPEALRVGEVLELFAAQDAITAQTGALPTVYAGDYNSAAPSGGGYQTLRSRLSDLWLDSHGGVAGPGSDTCCANGLLDSPVPDFDTRIDLLLGTAGIRALSTYRIGDQPVDLPGDTWWGSDHAGVVGTFVVD